METAVCVVIASGSPGNVSFFARLIKFNVIKPEETETEEKIIRNNPNPEVNIVVVTVQCGNVHENDDRNNATAQLLVDDGEDDHSEQMQTPGVVKHYLRLHKE